MDKAQYDDWKDFASRMARQWQPRMSATRQAGLVRLVERLVSDAAEYGLASYSSWDAAPYPCDFFEEWLEAEGHLRRDPATGERSGELGTMAMCCIKAGFDLAVAPSDGIVGSDFNVGLLKRMYPDGWPTFVREHLGAEMERAPDSCPVWL